MPLRHRPSLASRRGFTLIELLIAVAIVGILAALGVVGFNRYVRSAATSEATAVIQGIRAAEENFKSETLMYLGCSGCGAAGCLAPSGNLSTVYPQTSPVSDKKWAWVNPSHADEPCWRLLNVSTDGPVRFGYAVVAGAAGTSVGDPGPSGIGLSANPGWPSPPADPWFVVQATGNQDGDSVKSYFISSSFSGEVFVRDETE